MFPALPNRPLFPRPPGWGRVNVALEMFGLLVAVALVGASLVWVLPDIVLDWRVRDAAVPIQGGRSEDRHCSAQLFIVSCGATLHAPAPGGAVSRGVFFLFAGDPDAKYTLRVVGDPARPALITTDLALDSFWDRVLTLAGTWAVFGFLCTVGGRQVLANRRRYAAWRRLPTVPVPLELTAEPLGNGARWTVRGETGAVAQWVVPRKAKPFLLRPGIILGLSGRDGAALFPLDASLRWVELSEAERRGALASRAPEAGSRTGPHA